MKTNTYHWLCYVVWCHWNKKSCNTFSNIVSRKWNRAMKSNPVVYYFRPPEGMCLVNFLKRYLTILLWVIIKSSGRYTRNMSYDYVIANVIKQVMTQYMAGQDKGVWLSMTNSKVLFLVIKLIRYKKRFHYKWVSNKNKQYHQKICA